MSVVEDTRKLLQDFLAPELRAIAVRGEILEKKVDENDKRDEQRLAVLENHVDQRFAQVDQRFTQVDQRFTDAAKHIDQRFDDAEKRADQAERRAEQRHQEMLGHSATKDEVEALRLRVSRLEARDNPHQ